MNLRAAILEDAPATSALLKAAYAVLMPDGHDDPVMAAALPMMSRANPALLASGTYYLAETGCGQLVGAGGWTEGRPENGKTQPGLAHIRHFAVHPDWTGHGIGRALYEKCSKEARAIGSQRFNCYATHYAQGFYKALGFRSVRQLEVRMGPDLIFPAVLMKASLGQTETL